MGSGDRSALGKEGVPRLQKLEVGECLPATHQDRAGNNVMQDRDDHFWTLPLLRTSEKVERKKCQLR